MKKSTLRFIYHYLSYFKEKLGWLIALCKRAASWKWQWRTGYFQVKNTLQVVYLGRKDQLQLAMQLLGLHDTQHIQAAAGDAEKVIISEFPLPRSICVPVVLSTVVRLDQTKPFDASIAHINKSRVRYYKKNRDAYRLKQVFDDVNIDIAIETMLKPYADSRHGDGVSHLTRAEVVKMARYTGALHLLFFNDEVVGCKVSKAIKRDGKRYWRSIRAGYIEPVFSDAHRFGEIHNMNMFLAMEWAFNQGYDYFDKSIALACPFNKVLQWKRSYRGLLSFMGNYTYFHVSPPKNHESTFFWHSPLFANEHGRLTLHIGIPPATSDEAAIEYLSFMGFGGVSTVYVHSQTLPSAKVVHYLEALYKHFESRPMIKLLH